MSTLSVLLIINNEEKQLEDCLKSVSFANQLIIVLDKCIDSSERIAKDLLRKFILVLGRLKEIEEILESVNVHAIGYWKLMLMREYQII